MNLRRLKCWIVGPLSESEISGSGLFYLESEDSETRIEEGGKVIKMENKNEDKKESALPMWVMLITLVIGLIIILKFILFSD